MSLNLIEAVQQNLGYPVLQKIDSNTQQVIINQKPEEDKFSQAAIPAILTGLYSYVQTDEGAKDVLLKNNSANWLSRIFDENKKEVIETISSYANQSVADPLEKLNAIASEAVKIVNEQLHPDATIKDVKIFFSHQKNTILLYLPAALNIGALLNDDTLDDNTNKMEGPISNIMHSIGNAFTNPVTDDEITSP